MATRNINKTYLHTTQFAPLCCPDGKLKVFPVDYHKLSQSLNPRNTWQGSAVPKLLCCPPPPTPPAAPTWIPAPGGTRAAGQQQGPGADTAAAITRVKEKVSHLFWAGSCRSSSRHPHPPAAGTWRRVHHRCETISLSALTRRRNLSSLQRVRGSLGFV